ncbi:hypothetical protein [Geobacillus sp. C56-T2]|uniref:hypothetical protein n=1 Tax=Geobacillus sp. C56-T2 TaxID=600773 RepID=UPI0011A6E6BE|nr:hypothetical protein [Geobacillus sp. C56-T2]NNV06833.1 hypothetical protein [Geobacillus sp. MMMUD3]TWG30819.1 hypothetical protein GC56T2_2001 [Geobacillus sp. C56-T2]
MGLDWVFKREEVKNRQGKNFDYRVGIVETEKGKEFIYYFDLPDHLQEPAVEWMEQERRICKGDEQFPIIKGLLIHYFSEETAFDLEVSENKIEVGKNINSSRFWDKYKETIETKVKEELEQCSNDIVRLLLLQKLLQMTHILADPIRVSRISDNERKHLNLFGYFVRMHILHTLLQREEMRDYDQLRQNIENEYRKEFEHFCEYLSEEAFYRYDLPSYTREVFAAILGKTHFEFDDIVVHILEKYMNYRGPDQMDQSEKKCISKVINGCLLPRYNVPECLKLVKVTKNRGDRINIHLLPRLLSSILVGFLPVLLTGELYEWYRNVVKDHIIAQLIIVLFSVLLLLLAYGYLSLEIKNFLGFWAWKRARVIFGRGLAWTFLIASLLIPFSGYMLLGEEEFGKIESFWGFIERLAENNMLYLLLFQVALSYFLGIVLQAIWEDKPITQPL